MDYLDEEKTRFFVEGAPNPDIEKTVPWEILDKYEGWGCVLISQLDTEEGEEFSSQKEVHSQRTTVDIYGSIKQKHEEEEARLEREIGVRLGGFLKAIYRTW